MNPTSQNVASDSFNEIATVRIELRHTDPLIWRQVEVPTSITLKVLHDIIQVVMGWFDYHLWEFTVGKQRYGLPMDDDWGTKPRIAATKVRLRDVLKPRKTVIDYTYDFGDCWEHRLTVTECPFRSARRLLSALYWRRTERTARGLRRHPRLLRTARGDRRPYSPEPYPSQRMGRRLRSRYVRRTPDQIRPWSDRKPSQRRQGAPRQQKAPRLGCVIAATSRGLHRVDTIK